MSWMLPLLLGVLFLGDPSEVRPHGEYIEDIEDDGGRMRAGEAEQAVPKGEEMRISSDRCDMDRNEGIVLFDGNVLAEYVPSCTLQSDRLFAFFKSNELQRVVAVGHVEVKNEERLGKCEVAVFERMSAEIEMRGTKDTEAKLKDGDTSEIRGNKVKFWLNREQIEVTDSEILFMKGSKEGGFKDVL